MTSRFQIEQNSQNASDFQVKSPRVSVVMPTYNQAHLISKSIQSVLNQTYQDFELIVVIDGSPDNTREIVAQFDYPVRVIWQENQGLPGARNTGIRAARGEIIALLDGDDLYEPDFLSVLISLLDSYPKADAVYGVAQFVDENNNLLPQRTGGAVPPERLYDQLLRGNFMTPMCMVAYKRCYEQVGFFDTSLQKGEWDMWLQFAHRFTVISTDRVLARYRVLPQSMSAANPVPMLQANLAVLQKHFGNGSLANVSAWTLPQRQAYGRCHIATAVEYLQSQDEEQAYPYLREAFKVAPELLAEFDVFYELGCANQVRGFRGDFSLLDVSSNAQVLLRLLAKLFGDPEMAVQIEKYRGVGYANTYFVLGTLYYGARQFGQARRFLARAVLTKPGFGLKRQLVITLLKSLLGVKLIDHFKSLRQKSQ